MTIRMLPQPDDVTCGPTSLHAVYRYFDLDLGLDDVLASVDVLEEGGTLAVMLGLDALRRGFSAQLYTYNLTLFDPSWAGLAPEVLYDKLDAQLAHKQAPKLVGATKAYQAFLEAGGQLCFGDLTPALLHRTFDHQLPILAGLSATYLYGTPRELPDHHHPDRLIHDDVRGEPTGHFVVLCGFDGDRVDVADPYKHNPISRDHHYRVPTQRLLNAILLGVVTYDANLLILAPAD